MVCIASITAHDSARLRRMGLRRALLMRRANLGDCHDAPTVLRRMASRRYLRTPACVVPLPGRRLGEPSTADLAVQVSRLALERYLKTETGFDASAVGALIYCHDAPDARSTDSTAGRLQFDLQLRRACAFSVSQAHNTAALIALDMAAGLIDGPEACRAVLLVAADKLVFGKPPADARTMVWSDVAAAAVLTREAAAGWRVDAVKPGHFPSSVGSADVWPPREVDTFRRHIADTLVQTLAAAGLRPADLAAVVTGSCDPAFVGRVNGLAGLGEVALSTGDGARGHHAACADVLARLAGLEGAVAPGRTVLAWSHGNNGEFACALTTRIG